MINYVVGMDGGGTKTTVIIADMKGIPLHSFQSGGLNCNGQSDENVRSHLSDILDKTRVLMGGLSCCKAICIGAAGISNEEAVKVLTGAVREKGYTGRLVIAGDHEAALYGALGKPEGIILIAGTGSICFGKNASGQTHRTGGFGHLVDDEGSGYAIGRDILTAVVRAHDGRIEKTILTELVYDALGLTSIQDVIRFVYSKETSKRDIAALSPQLSVACARQDRAALLIADKCSTELARLVVPVAEKLGMVSGEIVLAGGILIKDEVIRRGLEAKLKAAFPDMTCCLPRNSAAFGAVLMALNG